MADKRFRVTRVADDHIEVTDTMGVRDKEGNLPRADYYVDTAEYTKGDWVDIIIRKQAEQ